jgi:YbbR domain-containing protein
MSANVKPGISKILKQLFVDNFSYKLVSLVISLILWLTILGRRDFVITKNMDLNFNTTVGMQVIKSSEEQVKVKFSGPKTALKKFTEGGGYLDVIPVDLTNKEPGQYTVEIPLKKIEVPLGIKVISIEPENVLVHIEKK